MAEYDIIIKRGTIVDGTRTPRYVSDIAIKDWRIVQIGGQHGSSAAKVLDASSLIVAPGFVDLHTHHDAQVQWDPYCTLSRWHGVTSVAIGNCGFGLAPCEAKDREPDEQLVGLEGAHYNLSYLPAHFGGFRDRGLLQEGTPADIVVYDLEMPLSLHATDLPPIVVPQVMRHW